MQDVSSSGLMNGKPPPADVKPQLKRLKKKTENKQIEKAKQNQAQIDDSERNSGKKTQRDGSERERGGKMKASNHFLHCTLVASIFKNVKGQQIAALWEAWCLATLQPSELDFAAICSILCLHVCQRF